MGRDNDYLSDDGQGSVATVINDVAGSSSTGLRCTVRYDAFGSTDRPNTDHDDGVCSSGRPVDRSPLWSRWSARPATPHQSCCSTAISSKRSKPSTIVRNVESSNLLRPLDSQVARPPHHRRASGR